MLVVASATLAILLVCFSIYQYSQSGPESTMAPRTPRLPSPPTQPDVSARNGVDQQPASAPVGQGVAGAGQNITITIYPREGTRARMELSVSDWIPKDGSDQEFLLTDPQVRMRTRAGNDVRVTARRGVLEAQRKSGGGLDPKRGQLTGNVVIEYDRRTEKEKALLPEEVRHQIDPAELVRIEMEQIDFDLEYDKVVVPGSVSLTARDVGFVAQDLEIRFNEADNRVESLRISRGGRIEIFERGQLGMSVPGIDRREDARTSLLDWLRTTIQSRLEQQQKESTAVSPPPSSATTVEADGVPLFRAGQEEKTPDPPVTYFARFDGDVDARQLAGEITRSRLRADALEIIRDFSDEDKGRVRSSAGSGAAPAPAVSQPITPTQDRIVLEWTGKLLVEALLQGDERRNAAGSIVTALGAPARLWGPEGEAVCSKLTYEPEGSHVRLTGTQADPVIVKTARQGTMTGVSAWLRRSGDALDIQLTGPGRLLDDSGLAAGAAVNSSSLSPPDSLIDFTGGLTAQGRFVKKTTVDFTGGISTREHRVLDRASISGQVAMQQKDTRLEADHIDIEFADQFAAREGGFRGAGIERLLGRGNVALTQAGDRITCESIDVALAADSHGQSRPVRATAKGNVLAVQGERTLQARDRLIADFATVAEEGADSSTARSDVRRLLAFGAVTVFDPEQELDLSAEELDCTIGNGREIENAVVSGLPRSPASVRLDTLTVVGEQITLNVPDQRADVPAEGRLTFMSAKDLDGRKLSKPMPIIVTWQDSMSYRGQENRADFYGRVHATSETATTFDCDQLRVEFEDRRIPGTMEGIAAAPEKPRSGIGNLTGGILQPFFDSALGTRTKSKQRLPSESFAKEPVYILADGHAIAQMSEMDAASGELATRSRIAGDRLSVNLRSEVSKMLIESPGTLQLEDFRPDSSSRDSTQKQGSDLFAVNQDSGPSKTLIEWRDRMWYDFAAAQTQFEGHVQLKHFSGAALERLFEMPKAPGAKVDEGRSTFLTSDVLSVNFLERDARAKDTSKNRMGRLSSDRLRQFQASGSVVLQDQVKGLSVTADRIVYERPQQVLAIFGSRDRKAHIIKQEPGRLPHQVSTERLVYNLTTGKMELVRTSVKSH